MADEEMMRLSREEAAVDVFPWADVETMAVDADISGFNSVVELPGDTGTWPADILDSISILELLLLDGVFPFGCLEAKFGTSSTVLPSNGVAGDGEL